MPHRSPAAAICLRRPALLLLLASLTSPASTRADTQPFANPQPGRTFVFPRDHGSHPHFRLEWWYVTGHLHDEAGNRFGFQSTFFRSAAPRPSQTPTPPPGDSPSTPTFGPAHIFLAHTALLEVATGRFLHQERLHREGHDAGADTHTLHVWNANHSLTLTSPVPQPEPRSTPTELPIQLSLHGSVRAEASWNLTLTPAKPLVVFGTNGVSRKGATPEAASHYLTFPRLSAEGTLTLDGKPRKVRGQAWMDHEFSSSQLAPDQVGWDWASVQFIDGRELMAYRLRSRDGGTDPFSTLAWIDADGRVTHQSTDTFQIDTPGQWRSPRTGAKYPNGLRITTRDPATGQPVQLHLKPLAPDQELAGSIGAVPYWEGACRVLDATGNEVGSAYVELTGYAGDLNRRLR